MEGFGVFVLVGWFFHEENKAFFLSNLQDSEIFEIKGRLSYLKKKSFDSTFLFSSWKLYTSCASTEGTSLTSTLTPAPASQRRCANRKIISKGRKKQKYF